MHEFCSTCGSVIAIVLVEPTDELMLTDLSFDLDIGMRSSAIIEFGNFSIIVYTYMYYIVRR